MNSPANHIECKGKKEIKNKAGTIMKGESEFSFFVHEEEVLLFPYFGFLTLKNEKLSNNELIDQITIMEIPF